MFLTDGWDGGDDFAEFELVEDGGFTGCVESDHQDPHLLLAEEAFEQGSKHIPHGGALFLVPFGVVRWKLTS